MSSTDAIQFGLFDPVLAPEPRDDEPDEAPSLPGDEAWLFPDGEPSGLLPPRPYQVDVIGKIVRAWERGVDRQVVVMPTGSGKTVVAAHVVPLLKMPTLFLVHRDELVDQTRTKMQSVNPDLEIGLVKAESDDYSAPFVICSVQTLAREARLERVLRGFPTRRLILSDEAHHDPAETRRRAIEALKPTLLVGFTATPQRADGLGLDVLYREITAHLGLLDLMERGVLARCVGYRVETKTDLDAVPTRDGDFAEQKLADAVDTPARNQLIVDTWKERCADRRSTTGFCAGVAHAQHLAECFRDNGIPAAAVWGEMPKDERRRVLRDYEDGKLKVITNRDVLTEGWDSPVTDCLLLARPTKSRPLYIQIVGRGLRTSPATGKQDLLVIDFADATRKHQLVTLPSLASVDGLMEGQVGEQLAALEALEADPDERAPDESLDLLEYARVKKRRVVRVDLLDGSPLVWRAGGRYHWTSAGDGVFFVLRRERGGFVAYQITEGERYVDRWNYPRRADPTILALHPRPIPDFGYAMGLVEGRGEAFLRERPYLKKSAGWRRSGAPPTEAQRRLAASLRIKPLPDDTIGSLGARMDEALFGRVYRRAEPFLPDAG